MTVPVPLDALPEAWDEVDDTCFLLTTNEDGSPHPAHVTVTWDGSSFIVSAGRRSHRNSARGGQVTLLWPARTAEEMNLLVDGSPEAEASDDGGGAVVVRPTSAIWHRRPGQNIN